MASLDFRCVSSATVISDPLKVPPPRMAADSACGAHAPSDGDMHKTSAGAHTHDDGAMHMPSAGESNRITDRHGQGKMAGLCLLSSSPSVNTMLVLL